MSLHYLVKLNMCHSVYNHSNASSKRHNNFYGQTQSQQMFKVFASGFDTRIKTISPLINFLICWISDHASIVSSGTLAGCLCVWCVPVGPTDLREMPVSLAIWRVVLCVPGAPSWLTTKSLTASMFSAARDVWGLPLPGCRSVVQISRSF